MIVFAILCMSAFSLQAGVRIGVKGGVNLANASISTDALKTDNFTGFQVGPIIELSTLSGFGLDAAVLYSQQGFEVKELSFKEKAATLDVPVNLKLKFSLADQMSIYLSAGPYLSFKLDDQVSFGQIQQEWSTKKFGVGLNFGAGVELLKHLQVGVNYQLCLNDDYSNGVSITDYEGRLTIPDFNAKTRIWSITAAFFF